MTPITNPSGGAPGGGGGSSAGVGCKVYATATTDGSGIAWTNFNVAFQAERFDDAGFHDNVVNKHRLTIPDGLDGLYVVRAEVPFGAGGERYTRITKNHQTDDNPEDGNLLGQFRDSGADGASGTPSQHQIVAIERLVAGDFVVVQFASANSQTPALNATLRPMTFGLARLGD